MSTDRPVANHNLIRAANDFARPDHVQPFMIETSQLRGRIVRMTKTLNTILHYHDYPEKVARLMAEALSLTALLAGMLKYDGVFTFQVKGDGAVPLLVCDLTSKGHLRGYASFDADKLALLDGNAKPTVGDLCGKGYLAFTIDQKRATDRYQGIVPLEGDTLADAVRYYFQQSEQIKTAFEVAVGVTSDNQWQSAAIMLQKLPNEGGTMDAPGDGAMADPEALDDDWGRSMMMLNTLSAAELLDTNLTMNDILFRLFHEDGVRVFKPLPLAVKCRCSRKKIAPVIEALPVEEQRELAENGKITVTCEFCNKHYKFPVEPA